MQTRSCWVVSTLHSLKPKNLGSHAAYVNAPGHADMVDRKVEQLNTIQGFYFLPNARSQCLRAWSRLAPQIDSSITLLGPQGKNEYAVR